MNEREGKVGKGVKYHITVSSTREGKRCHRCGREISKPYGHDRELGVRHLPILGRKTYIRLRPKRY